VSEKYYFSSIVTTAEVIASCLDPRCRVPLSASDTLYAKPREIPALIGVRLNLARLLLGVDSYLNRQRQETTWSLNLTKMQNRLRAAGINCDASPWRVVDPRAAGFAWRQLCEPQPRFSEKKQAVMLNSDEQPLDINIAFEKVPKSETPKRIFEQEHPEISIIPAAPPQMGQKLNDHFDDKGSWTNGGMPKQKTSAYQGYNQNGSGYGG